MREPTSTAAKRAATAQRIVDSVLEDFGERGLEVLGGVSVAELANVVLSGGVAFLGIVIQRGIVCSIGLPL